MVDSLVDSLVSLTLEKLAKVAEDEITLLMGVTNEITKLTRTFKLIQAVLQDAETQRVKKNAVKTWLENVKDVAYDIDDILDEWTMEALRSQAHNEGDGSCFSKKKVRSFLCPVTCFNHVKLRHRIGSRIKEVRGRLDDIEKEKSQLGLRVDNGERERVDSEVRQGEIRDRETSSLLDRQLIVGREDEKNEVLDLLLGESSGNVNEVPIVISIVGMGGLGKTTLAQLVYNDEKVMGHFDMRMWECVSEDFDVKRITESIIKSADTEFNSEKSNLDQLQLHLQEMLRAKRFLLVLDDIWSEDSEKWYKLSLPFQAGPPGSRIITTTRSEKVAFAMGRAHIHKLSVLPDDDCWLVFSRSSALDHRSPEERSELETIGREIVNKCGGLPLAAKVIGSAMGSKRTRREWELVLRSEIWNSGDVLGGILPALLLSYHDLPPALKQCFSYFSIFPKDSEIEKDVIVKLWVAQGFCGSDTSTDMEEIGGLYFDDLIRRSLLQDEEIFDYVKGYKMHDLVHDLAQSVAGSDCSLVQIGKQASSNFNIIRHSAVVSDEAVGEDREVASMLAPFYKAHKLRTLLFYSNISMVQEIPFHHWRRLRALNLSETSIEKLSPTVGQLKHLRFLDLSETDVEELPEEVCNCRNLQTLRLNGCRRLRKLPRGMRKMISLRHLELLACTEVKYLPQGIGRLTGLRTLTRFIVWGDNEGCKWGELKLLNNLQGSLEINGLENIRSRDEAREADLNQKQQLHELSLHYDEKRGERLLDEEVKRMEDVIEILQPHTNLKKLGIYLYKGSKLPKWIEDPVFSNLVKVELFLCDKCKQLPGLGKLPFLKYLEIRGMKEVRYVGGEFRGDDNNDGSGAGVSFPKLETLDFSEMSNWEEWELRGGDGEVMPSLLQLEIYKCPKLKELPSNLPSLLQLKIRECRKLKELPSNLPPILQKLSIDISNDGLLSGGPLPVLPNLNHLEIQGNNELTSIPGGWLGQLKSLKTLDIHWCQELRSLPEEELQQLTMLQELETQGCRLLKERYGEGGEDRDKIAHIPRITFDIY